MKKVSLILGMLMIASLVSASAFAGKAADWPLGAAGYARLQVIEGTIKAVDTQNNCLIIEGSAILGNEPLYVSSHTSVYRGTALTNLEDIRSAAKFTEADRLDFKALGVGSRVKSTFSIIGGKYVAETICQIR